MGPWLASSPTLKALRVALHVLYAFALVLCFPVRTRASQRAAVQRWSRQLLKILQVQVRLMPPDAGLAAPTGLLVANHVSWLDTVVLNAVCPVRFVAKAEVARWPLLGWLVRRLGTLFIARERKRDTARVNQEMTQWLLQGEHIAVFAQGTSTHGAQPVHFHSSLLQCAVDASAAVTPVAIAYRDVAGQTQPSVVFDGDMSLIASLCNVLRSGAIRVELHFLAAIAPAGLSRRGLAACCQTRVNAALQLV